MFLLTKVHSHLYEDRSLFFNHIYEDFLKWFMGTLVFSTLHCRNFSFFLFSIFFSSRTQKTQIREYVTFFHSRCSVRVFSCFCLLIWVLCFRLVVFLCFLCFSVLLVRARSFCKKTTIKSLKLLC